MTRRKPLPYSAGQLIDDAIMANTEAIRTLKPLIETDFTNLEVIRRIALAINKLHESIQSLKEIKNEHNR